MPSWNHDVSKYSILLLLLNGYKSSHEVDARKTREVGVAQIL
jgi:hypothetical protein